MNDIFEKDDSTWSFAPDPAAGPAGPVIAKETEDSTADPYGLGLEQHRQDQGQGQGDVQGQLHCCYYFLDYLKTSSISLMFPFGQIVVVCCKIGISQFLFKTINKLLIKIQAFQSTSNSLHILLKELRISCPQIILLLVTESYGLWKRFRAPI